MLIKICDVCKKHVGKHGTDLNLYNREMHQDAMGPLMYELCTKCAKPIYEQIKKMIKEAKEKHGLQ